MAADESFRWVSPPSVISVNLDRYRERAWAAIAELAGVFAAQMEAAAKSGASWQDRTGAARQSIKGFVVEEATRVVLYLVGQTPYFPYLELGTSRSRPYPILMPTLEAHYAPLMQALRRLVQG